MKSLLRPWRQALVLAAALGCAAPVLAQPRKVDQENLYHYWILLNTSVTMQAPNSGLNLQAPGCAAVTYTIGSDGVPRDVTVAKLVPKSDLAMVARSAVSQFRYGPSLTNRIGDPIATYYVVPFNAPADAAQRKQLLQACALPGFGA